ncbi:AGE family epimerase/isomerase [Vallitalea guaymasensis]|uniref:AGE family epimerase/isomerase n=1 Tax=Vallitalea guaymasensis TaxID=1185412 RepID=UPI00187D6BD1|nr:AGE family epimerase/isomerase [Vallitalea guaymasensis]
MRETNYYKEQIEKDFWPYWEKYIDTTYGGVLNCINNYGDKIINENKYSWSQGRFLWILSSLYELSIKGILDIDKNRLKNYMNGNLKFIFDNCLLEDYSTVFLLERDGTKIKDKKTGRYDTSIYSDCFIIIGICKYVQNIEDESLVKTILNILNNTTNKISSKYFYTEPYPIPEGYETHAVNMIMVNTLYEVIQTLDKYSMKYDKYVEQANNMINTILYKLCEDGLIREFVYKEESKNKRLLDRHVTPGHALESMWFIIEYLEKYQDIRKHIDTIGDISIKSFDIGWDEKFGGLLRFVDREGGVPKGESQETSFEKLIMDTHNMKIWWPQSEALVIFHKLYQLTGNQKYLERYNKIKEYVFRVFPNEEIGEWIQIRLKDGSPLEKVVALPVKDPFHIMRAFIKIIESEE